MKRYLTAVALLLCSAPVFAQESLTLKIKLQVTDSYALEGDSRAVGTRSTGNMSLEISGSRDGESVQYSTGPVQVQEANRTTLEIRDGSVRMIDAKNSVDYEARASVSRRIFGGALKSVVIPAAEVQAALGESLVKQGKSFLSNFRFQNSEGQLEYRLDTSDYNCSVEKQALSCSLNAEVVLTATSN